MGPVALTVTALGVLGAAAFGIYKFATRHKHDPATCPTEAAVLEIIQGVDKGTTSLTAARAQMTAWEKTGCVAAVAALRSIIAAKEAKAGTGGKTAECEAAIVSLPTDARTTVDGSPAPILYELAQRAVRAEKENDPGASTAYFNAAAAIDAEILTGIATKFAAASSCLKARGVALGAPLTPLHAVLGHKVGHMSSAMRRHNMLNRRRVYG